MSDHGAELMKRELGSAGVAHGVRSAVWLPGIVGAVQAELHAASVAAVCTGLPPLPAAHVDASACLQCTSARGMLTMLSMMYCWPPTQASYLRLALAAALSCVRYHATCMHHL